MHCHGNKMKMDFPFPPFLIPPFSFSQLSQIQLSFGRPSVPITRFLLLYLVWV